MKKLLIAAALGTLLLSPPLFAQQPAAEGSIASKVEELGKMTYLKVTDLRAAKRDGLLRIQATITNSNSENQRFYYRFKWLDSDGFEVWEEESWKPGTIYGLQKKTINAVSPSLKATDFRIELQSPDNEGSFSSGKKPAGGGILDQ